MVSADGVAQGGISSGTRWFVGRLALVPLLAAVMVVGGCCKESEKREARERLDRRIQEMRENCLLILDPSKRDDCLTELNKQTERLESKYLEYLTACANGNKEVAEEILRTLRSAVSTSRLLILANGDVVNDQPVFGREDLLLWDVAAVRQQLDLTTEQIPSALPWTKLDFVTGGGSKGSAAPAEGEFEFNPEAVGWTDGLGWRYTLSGSVLLKRDDLTISASASGEFWFAPAAEGNDAPALSPTRGFLTLSSAFGWVKLVITGSEHNSLVVDADGNGSLQLQLTPQYSPEMAELPLVPQVMLLRIPARVSADGRRIDLSTFGEWVNGRTIAPVGPFPVADFNNDGVADINDFNDFVAAWQAASPEADVNIDGVVDQDDFEYFLTFWSYEMGN